MGVDQFVTGNSVTDPDVSSLTTDDAVINNAPTSDDDALRWQEGVETGTVTLDGQDNSTGNDDWGQGASATQSASFANAFASTPEVAVSPSQDVSSGVGIASWIAGAINKSTSGFDVRVYQMSANDESGTTDAYGVDYVASEGR